jgi:hypothetical protein
MASIALVILAHDDRASLRDLTRNISHFCPGCTQFLYNSGSDSRLADCIDIECIPSPRILEYARITPFFVDIFEWFMSEPRQFDFLVNAETDMLFIRRGFESFVQGAMRDHSYMAPLFSRGVSVKSKWRPYRSLRPQLEEWMRLLELDCVNRAFSPAQVFSREYVELLLNHPKYPRIRQLIEQNRSFTLQEVLLPTLVDFLRLDGRSYPEGMKPIIRYRPYQSVTGIRRGLGMPNAYLVHPVRRLRDDPARKLIVSLLNGPD